MKDEELEEEFSPEKYTQKELVKHLWRNNKSLELSILELTDTMKNVVDKFENMHKEDLKRFEELRESDMEKIDSRLDILEQYKAATESTLKWHWIIMGASFSLIGLLATIVMKMNGLL